MPIVFCVFYPSLTQTFEWTLRKKTSEKWKTSALCFQCVDGVSRVDTSLKRVAVVEDFFDIIYAMHVEMGADPGRAPKHAGQKKTYKAVSESNRTQGAANPASAAHSSKARAKTVFRMTFLSAIHQCEQLTVNTLLPHGHTRLLQPCQTLSDAA